ncbi:MAG: DUF2750 domain-containing protein [Motiliproteus sp.]|nr:DUF2750 domain-containing protein [Motiliproteus sp.]MCW9050814.1 DUF2750 domain-containing protein [Motiliproteus sp.]
MTQLTQDLEQNYRIFIEDALDSGQVWALKSKDGWVFCESEEFEETDVIPVWSNESDAKAQCSDEWANNKVESIDLKSFVENWLTGMDEDGLLVGPNWNADMEGLEVEPGELAHELFEADA